MAAFTAVLLLAEPARASVAPEPVASAYVTDGTVFAIAYAPDGTTYIGGSFANVCRTDGTDCQPRANIARLGPYGTPLGPLGTGTAGTVRTIAASGSDVYVGGEFASAGGVADTGRIARWDGAAWKTMGTGGASNRVNALAVDGTDVYAGGFFGMIGGVAVGSVARWNGAAWSALGTGLGFSAEGSALAARRPMPTCSWAAVWSRPGAIGSPDTCNEGTRNGHWTQDQVRRGNPGAIRRGP
jgi:hypothetical protein